MLTKYLRAAMSGARYEVLEQGGHYAYIPGFEGVWADAVSMEECRDELEEVLEEWAAIPPVAPVASAGRRWD